MSQILKWIRKRWSDILLGLFIILLLIPQTGKPIKVFINRTLSFSPSIENVEDRRMLKNFDWKLSNMEGEIVDLDSFKGQKIILNFWATWCPPCIAEMPSFQALYNDYHGKAVFLFVSNEERSVIQKFIIKHELNLPVYQVITDTPIELENNSLPTTFLIDENGAILIEKVGAANWNSEKVRLLLEE